MVEPGFHQQDAGQLLAEGFSEIDLYRNVRRLEIGYEWDAFRAAGFPLAC